MEAVRVSVEQQVSSLSAQVQADALELVQLRAVIETLMGDLHAATMALRSENEAVPDAEAIERDELAAS